MLPERLPGGSTALPQVHQAAGAAGGRGGLAVAHVHAHHGGGGEGAAHVPLGLGQDDVHLGHEHAAQRHRGAQAHREAHGDDLVVAAEVDWHEGQPDDAGGIHGEGDVLGLVEVGRHVARLEGVEGAAEDEQAVVAQRRHHAQVGGVADEVDLADAGVVVDDLGRLHDEEAHDDAELEEDEDEGDDQLGAGAHEARLLGADLLLAAGQDAGDAVGLGDQGGVAHGGRQADARSLQVAVDHVRLGDEAEGAEVAQADARQDDVAELAAGGLHHRRVPVYDKDRGDKESGQEAEAGEDHGSNGLRVTPAEVLHRNGVTA